MRFGAFQNMQACFQESWILNGLSRPERTPQVFSDTSSCGDAVPQPGSSSQSSSGPFSDAQILYYTLVQDGAIPSGFMAEFESLVKNVEMDATRQARNSYRDEVQSATWLHERSKAEEQSSTRPSCSRGGTSPTAFQEPPPEDPGSGRQRQKGCRGVRKVSMGSRSRAHPFTDGHAHGETPHFTADELSVPRSRTQASTLRGKVRTVKKFMAWLGLTHQLAFPTSYLQYA